MLGVLLVKPWFQFWPDGANKNIQYPTIPLFNFLVDSAGRQPERPALVFYDKRLTYSELNLFTNRLANCLISLGLKKNERVTLFLPNIPEFVISYYGVLKAGGIVTSVNPLYKETELKYQIRATESSTIIIHSSLLPVLRKVLIDTPMKNILVVDGDDHEFFPFNDGIGKCSIDQPSVGIVPKEDIAVIQFTGGTTVMPKGAMMTHNNLVSNAIMNAKWFSWSDRDIVLKVLPLCHTWGACSMNSVFYVGASMVLMGRFDPEEVLKTIERARVTILYGSATMFNMLVNYPHIGEFDLSSLRCVKAGAMPIPEEIKRRWDKLGVAELNLGYGLTEASPETHNNPPGRVKVGTIGIPMMDTDAKIVDVGTGLKELSSGEVGELVINGPQVMKGYLANEEETKIALRNGWLYTGDLALMDDEGYFRIVDRKKDLIKYKGYSVFPVELEDLLYKHPSVKECAVVGKPSPEVGEIPKAYIVIKDGATTTKDELLEFCDIRIAPYKKIREVEFIEKLPKTSVGKILKRTIKKMQEMTDKSEGQ